MTSLESAAAKACRTWDRWMDLDWMALDIKGETDEREGAAMDAHIRAIDALREAVKKSAATRMTVRQ